MSGPALSMPRKQHSCAELVSPSSNADDTKIIVVGGLDNYEDPVLVTEIFDGQSWHNRYALPWARLHTRLITHLDRPHLFGGQGQGQSQGQDMLYHADLMTFSEHFGWRKASHGRDIPSREVMGHVASLSSVVKISSSPCKLPSSLPIA